MALAGDPSRSRSLAQELDPIGALALLQLGRALVLSRDIARAKTAYGEFLTLWKEADLDIPIYKHAKAEFARL